MNWYLEATVVMGNGGATRCFVYPSRADAVRQLLTLSDESRAIIRSGPSLKEATLHGSYARFGGDWYELGPKLEKP